MPNNKQKPRNMMFSSKNDLQIEYKAGYPSSKIQKTDILGLFSDLQIECTKQMASTS